MGRRRKTNSYLPERMYERSGTFYFVDQKGKWHNLAKDLHLALAKYAQLTDTKRACRTIGDLITRYLLEVSPKKAVETYKTEVRQQKVLRAAFGEMLIEDLTPRAIYQFMDARAETSEIRANRELAMLSAMYRKAVRWGYAEMNPCLGIERFQEQPRDRYVTDNEYKAFQQFLVREKNWLILRYMDFKVLTGLRQTTILTLMRGALRDEGIYFHASKNKEERIIEWTPLLRQATKAVLELQSESRRVQSMHLFATRKGTPYTPDGFRSIWQRAMAKALKEGAVKKRFQERDIRAKTGSDATSDLHAQELLAHLNLNTTKRHYRRKVPVVKPLG